MATLKKLNRAVLALDDGREVEVERIGRGRYTTAWANGSHVYLQTDERDASKEMLANLARRSGRNQHLPDCHYLGELGARHRLYSMPKYRKVTARDTRVAWELLKCLITLRERARRLAATNDPKWDSYALNAAFRELIDDGEGNNISGLPDALQAALLALLDEAANYGEYTLEFRRANVAADGNGTLILLDPLFDLREVREDSERRMRAARGY